MDILYRSGQGTVSEVLRAMKSPPSYSAVRATLKTLEEKGHLRHRREGVRYVYYPKVPRETARRSALKHLAMTFFDNSVVGIVSALLEERGQALSAKEAERLERLIEQAKEEGR